MALQGPWGALRDPVEPYAMNGTFISREQAKALIERMDKGDEEGRPFDSASLESLPHGLLSVEMRKSEWQHEWQDRSETTVLTDKGAEVDL